MGCDSNDANLDVTPDPEYNLERLHTPPSDEWYYAKCTTPDGSPCPYSENCERGEEPADNTYHPRDEELLHQYAPQDLTIATDPNGTTRVVNRDPSIPAYLPNVNSTLPDPAYPAPEPDNMHVMTYGTIEDVVFGDDNGEDPQRENGLVSFSVRDEFDDLIHTDFHTLNPLSLLNESNVWNGKRVRVDIQDYKNVIEWFVYNYPMELVWYDSTRPKNSLLIPRQSDGVYKPYTKDWQDYYSSSWAYQQFRTGMLKTKENAEFDEWWQALLQAQPGGTGRKSPSGIQEDWEYEPTSNFYGEKGYKELHRSFLEIGQMDGNKKITLWQFFELLKNYFHLDDLWWITRNQELRLAYLEWDTWKEDNKRNVIVHEPSDYPADPDTGAISGTAIYEWLSDNEKDNPRNCPWSNWRYDGHTAPEGELYFVGNVENRQFSVRMDYRDSIHFGHYAFNGNTHGPIWWNQNKEVKGGREAVPLTKPGVLPDEFRPSKFQWAPNYGVVFCSAGAWEYVLNYTRSLDIGFDVDGRIWAGVGDFIRFTNVDDVHSGAFFYDGQVGPPPDKPQHGDWEHYSGYWQDIQYDVWTFGGIITLGDDGEFW